MQTTEKQQPQNIPEAETKKIDRASPLEQFLFRVC